MTTTSSLDGWEITDYVGPVSAHLVIGTGLFTDVFSGLTDFFGTHSRSYQKKLDRIGDEALDLIEEKAARLGADAVLGLRVDHDEISGAGKSMLMVTASGTAVRARQSARSTGKDEVTGASDSLAADELRDLLERQRLTRLAEKGELDFSDETAWRFIVDNQVEEIAPFFVESVEHSLAHYAAGVEPSWRHAFEEYFSCLPPETAKRHLYPCIRGHPRMQKPAARLIHEYQLFDVDCILDLLKDDDARQRGVQLVLAHQRYYTGGDIPRLQKLADVIRQTFTRADTYTGQKGVFGSKKDLWRCDCGNEVKASRDRCPKCHRDQWGFDKGMVNPEQALEVLTARIEALAAAQP